MMLAEFLLARLGEDEAVAREAAQYVRHGEVIQTNLSRTEGDTYTSKRVELWQPSFVLADCEAKRAVIGRYIDTQHELGPYYAQAEGREYLLPVLRLLAQPYAAHSDYREEWRLDA